MPAFKGKKSEITVHAQAEILNDQNRYTKVPFRCTFRKLPADQVEELRRLEREEGLDPSAAARENLVGWSDLLDEDNNPIEFSQDAVEEAMDLMAYRTAIQNAFIRAQYNVKLVNSKN